MMGRRPNLPLALLAAVVAAGLVSAAPRPRASDVEAEVAVILGKLARPADIARGSAELVALGAPALAPLFEHLCAGTDGPAAALGVPARAAVHAALLQFPRDALLALLTREARSARDDRRREVGLALLGSFGGRDDLRLFLELGTPGDPSSPACASLRQALEGGLLGLCARDGGATRTLAGFFPLAPPGSQVVIVGVLGKVGGVEALGWLAGLLGRSTPESEMLLLFELGELAERTGGTDDALALERVRAYLTHPDRRLGNLACLAAAKLHDHEAVPDLVMLLGDEDANLRARALASLRALTGLAMSGEPEIWLAWLDRGLAFWDERAESCRVALVSGSAADAAAALADVAAQRLFAARAAELVGLALQRPERDLVRSACRALGGFHERAVRGVLLTLANHNDPEIAVEARASLRRLDAARSHGPRPLSNRIDPRSQTP